MNPLWFLLLLVVVTYITRTPVSDDASWLVVRRNVLPTDAFDRLRALLLELQTSDDGLVWDMHGRKRKTLCPVKYKEVYALLNHLVDGHVLNMCIDYRVYPKGSNGLDWHRDTRVMDGRYYEGVLTLWNDTDSLFEYKLNSVVRQLRTEPNTLVLVKPEGIMHRVTPVRRGGSRAILKCVYTPVGN